MPTPPSPRGHHPAWPASEDRRHTGFTRQPRVRWLSPGVLARTAVRVALSRAFGQFADRRELQKTESGTPLDLHGPETDGREFWLDFVADTGDGFDATATIADLLAADELTVGARDETHRTEAGRLLIMGGDEVYPSASAAQYNNRLVGPFRAMLPWTDRPRWLVALPGNHDWYDGLTSFLRLFCQQRWLGGWQTVQSRSYFAVRLPGGWWVWGVDTQLADELDKPQLDYFEAIAKQLRDDDSLILCWATPCWVEAGPEDPEAYAPFDYFQRTVLRDHPGVVRVALSGDLHHYARYAEAGVDPPAAAQRITAGGGGAYLAATHQLPQRLSLPPKESRDVAKRDPVDYELHTTYPDRGTSERLRSGVWTRVFGNSGLWVLPAALYGLLGFVIGQAFPELPDGWTVATTPLVLAALLLAGTYLGMAAFTGLRKRPRAALRRTLGTGHTLLHLALVLAAGYGLRLAARAWGLSPEWSALLTLAGCALAGATVGILALAAYLLVADRFGVNTNELFAAQAIQDYKCFLRLRIAEDGTLTIFPVKVERAARWEFVPGERAGSDRRWFRPVGGVEPAAELIEPPIVVAGRPTRQTGGPGEPPRGGAQEEVRT